MMAESDFLDYIRKQAEEGLKLWDSPSVSIGIIKDGRVVLCEGFGNRNVEQKLPATGKSLYQTGSCSKAFTSALVAILVDQGKLSWDDPIINYLPNVRFFEDYTTSNLTMRDILSHRSGLPRHEYAWYGTDFTKEELIFNLRYLEPNKPIRTKFQYNNYGYILAGYIVEKITGKSWEECVEEYILKPLGMSRTNMFIDAIKADPDHAEPYDRPDASGENMKGMTKIPFFQMNEEDYTLRKGSPAGPAAAVNSCAEEMLKWVSLHLNHGEYDGKRIISEKSMNELHKPNMLLPYIFDMPQEEMKHPSYGMGWFVESYRGYTLVEHGGNLDGFSAHTGFIPELNLGVVAYTNMNVSNLQDALAHEIYDYYIGAKNGDWVKRYHEYQTNQWKKRDSITTLYAGEKAENTAPSHPLEAYTGTYTRNGYTPVTIRLEDGKLYLKFIDADTELRHYHYDTFLTSNLMGGGEISPGLPVSFQTADFRSNIETLVMPLCFEDGAAPIRFKKQQEA